MIKTFDELEQLAIHRPSKKIALAMAEEADALTAVVSAAEKQIVEPILVGNEKNIHMVAERENLSISNFRIVPAEGEAAAAAKAVELVRIGEANLLMKGKVPTATIMKAVLNKETGIRGSGILSHVMILENPNYHKLLIMTDPALNIAPDLKTKAGIINNAVFASRKLGVEIPKIGIIGAVEKVNEAMPATLDAAILSKMADRGQLKNCIVDGPFALDNAVSSKSCEIKGIKTDVGGDADILLMPDIEAANVFYKAFAYLTNYKLSGVVLGADTPFIMTSRADSEMTKFLSILTAVSFAG